MARMYNNITGANITHKDVNLWGFIEAQELEIAIHMLSNQ